MRAPMSPYRRFALRFLALIAAKQDGLSFDDAWAELTRVGLVAELANWQNLVHGGEASGAVN